MAITFNPATPTARVGFPLTVTVYSSIPITSITNFNSDKMTVAVSNNTGYSAVLTINVLPPALSPGVIRVEAGAESANLTVTLLGIDTSFVSGLIGLSSNDVGTLCRGTVGSIQKINPWAFWKPVRRAFADQYKKLTETMVRGAKYGLSPTTFTTSNLNPTPWTYNNVRGGANEVCTLDDFAGYNHAAKPPMLAPIEIFWNQAETTEHPVLRIGFKCDNTSNAKYQGDVSDADYANMQIELGYNDNPLVPYPARTHLCVLMETNESVSLFCANAAAPIQFPGYGTAAEAGTIYLDRFSIFTELRSTWNPDTSSFSGVRHRMLLALNPAGKHREMDGNRAYDGYVFYDRSINAKTVGEYTYPADNIALRNGYFTNEDGSVSNEGGFFICPPQGEVFIDLYTYNLISWMTRTEGNLKILYPKVTTIEEGSLSDFFNIIDIYPGENTLSAATITAYENGCDGFIDAAFSIRVYNTGASMMIGDKMVTSGMSGQPLTLDAKLFSWLINRSGDDFIYVEMPKLFAWTATGVGTIYTSVNKPSTAYTHSKYLYNPNGSIYGTPSSIGANYAYIVHNNTNYYRAYENDIDDVSIEGGSYGFGLTEGNYADSIEIPAGTDAIVYVHMRHNYAAEIPHIFEYTGSEFEELHVGLTFGNGYPDTAPGADTYFFKKT